MMLRAFKQFHDTHPEFKLEIYGRGEAEGELKDYANKIGVSDSVRFMGFQKDVHNKILTALCFVSTSDFEGISNSMLEAMAIGLPCICTDCPAGGAAMFIKHGENGFLTKVGDENGVVKYLNILANSEETVQTLSLEAEKIRYTLTVDNICSKWIELM